MRCGGSGWAAAAAALALFLGAAQARAGAAVDAAETGARSLTAHYDFFIGGFSIAQIALDADLASGGYRARSQVQTRGVLELIIKGRVAAEAQGAFSAAGRLEPERYTTDFSTRAGSRSVEIAYDGRAPERIAMTPEAEPEEGVVPTAPDQRRGALDPLSAAVAALLPAQKQAVCNRTIPVFDGARRYDIVFVSAPDEPSEIARLAPDWPKPLIRCRGVYERIAGFDRQTLTNERYFPFDIWFEDSGDGIYRAVRLAGKTRLGFAIGTLRDG